MSKIPLWGKIVGGCSILVVLLLLIAGCTAIFVVASNDSPEPTSAPETTTTAPETSDPTTEPETEEPVTTEPEVDTTGMINTCIPDQDQAMAEVVASVTSSDVTIYTDQVYMVAEDIDLTGFYIVAGSDVGLIMIYTSTNVNGDPTAYAANEVAYIYTLLEYPEELGAPAIDTESDAYKVAEGCVS